MLCAPTEPKLLRAVCDHVSLTTEEYGCDFLVVGPTGILGIQRKEFPGDFLSSITDGRMNKVVTKMSALSSRVIVLEGQPQWTLNGVLLHNYGGEFKRSTLRAMEMSFHNSGIATAWTDNVADTADYLIAAREWWGKDRHSGFLSRPGPGRANEFGHATSEREWGIHILQGFDGIGRVQAERLYDHFGRIPLRWDVTRRELGEVRGIGPKRVDALTSTIAAKEEDE